MTSDFKVDEGPNKPPNMEFYRVKIVGLSDMVGRYLGQKWPKNVGRHLWTFPKITGNNYTIKSKR